jgi:hypothetical protein
MTGLLPDNEKRHYLLPALRDALSCATLEAR